MADWPRYGARPAHLVVLLAGFAVAGYAGLAMLRQGGFRNIVVWFALGVIGVDLMLLPLAALADHWLLRVSRRRPGPVPFINHVRVPAIISGMLLSTPRLPSWCCNCLRRRSTARRPRGDRSATSP